MEKSDYKENGLISKHHSRHEIKGHLQKSRHNLAFTSVIPPEYNDWALVVCYYAQYHAALSLALSKGKFSKNHDATICILIEDFYNKELSKEDIEFFNLLDAEDLLFYVHSKQKRDEASYSTRTKFGKSDVENVKLNTKLFVNKAEHIINELHQ